MLVKSVVYAPLQTFIVLQSSAPVPADWKFGSSTLLKNFVASTAVRDLETGEIYRMLKEDKTDYTQRYTHNASDGIYTDILVFPPFKSRNFELFRQREAKPDPWGRFFNIGEGLLADEVLYVAKWGDVEVKVLHEK